MTARADPVRGPLVTLAPGVHVMQARQRFVGLEVGARMTALETAGGLLVHSPIAVDPAVVAGLGRPRWVLAPNLLHHLHVGPWLAAGWEGWAAPGLPAKRSDLAFHGEVTPGAQPFGPEIELLPLASFPLTREVAVLHRPSRTLIVTDLVFHFGRDAPWLTRAVMRGLGGYPGCCTTVIERLGIRRDLARAELATLLGWEFERLVMAHGQVIERGGRAALRAAFAWLDRPRGALASLPPADASLPPVGASLPRRARDRGLGRG